MKNGLESNSLNSCGSQDASLQPAAVNRAASSTWALGWELAPLVSGSTNRKLCLHCRGFFNTSLFSRTVSCFCKSYLVSGSFTHSAGSSLKTACGEMVSPFGGLWLSSGAPSVSGRRRRPRRDGAPLLRGRHAGERRGKVPDREPGTKLDPRSSPVPALAFELFQRPDEGKVWLLLTGEWHR